MVIASKSGWSEHFIRWELPLSRGYAYYHAARVLEGERCRWPGSAGPLSRWLDGVRDRVRALRGNNKQSTPAPEQWLTK